MKKCLWCLLFLNWFISIYGMALHEEEKFRQLVLRDCHAFVLDTLKEKGVEEIYRFQVSSNGDKEWEFADYLREHKSVGMYLTFLAEQKICPKMHPGTYLDHSICSMGLWYCLEVMPDGKKCFFHLDNHYPDGMTKSH